MKQVINPIKRSKGKIKALDMKSYPSGYQDVEFWEIEGLTADNIEGKLTLLRIKLNEIIKRFN